MKKYTYEEVKSYFDKSNLTLLSKEYVNCKEPLQFICNCHFDKGIQSTTFDRVKNRYIYTCKYCAIEAVTSKNRIDIERVKSACKTLNFEFVDTYVKNGKTYVQYICNRHRDKGVQEKPWVSFKNTITNHKGCPYCNGKKRTSEDFDNDMKTLHPNIYIKEGQFKNRESRICCECLVCGNVWTTSAESLLSGHGCWECYLNKYSEERKKSKEEYEIELKTIHPKINLQSEYNGANNKIKCQCKEQDCNYVWETSAGSLLTLKYGCPQCALKNAKVNHRQTQNEYVDKLKNVLPHIDAVSQYVSSSEKMQFYCTIHNEYYYQAPYDALSGKCGCSKCQNRSIGERSVSKFFDDNNITYVSQYRFEDCKNIRTLPFDFYLPDYNICVEYDGELHYKSVDYFGGEKALQDTQMRDDIKTQYCINNNIHLIRIPYWEFENINTILSSELHLTNNI